MQERDKGKSFKIRLRSALGVVLAVCALDILATAGCGPRTNGGSAGGTADKGILRIGEQKGDALSLLQVRGDLDKRLAKEGIRVEWLEFPAGPQLIEALGGGSLDLGITGESPILFAQASGVPVVYLANIEDTTSNGDGLGLLVPKGSPIKTIADLKGKRIAVARGSTGQNFLLQVLQRAGIDYKDFTPAYLAPPDGRAAFDGGQVDAWAVWDPYLTAAEQANGAHILVNARGIVTPGSFFLSDRSFATAHPALIKEALEEVEKTIVWEHSHLDEASTMLSAKTGVDKATLRLLAEEHSSLRPIDDHLLGQEQQVADNFLRIGILPKPVVVREGALTPAQYAAITPAHLAADKK